LADADADADANADANADCSKPIHSQHYYRDQGVSKILKSGQ